MCLAATATMEVNTGKTEPDLAQSYTQFFNSTLFTRCTDIAGCASLYVKKNKNLVC